MVLFIGNSGIVRKYACTTCIKGHRSSRCRHTNRALIEVKPKGRPISQCTTCRERRKTMRAHVKCSCHRQSGGSVMKGSASQSVLCPPDACQPAREARRVAYADGDQTPLSSSSAFSVDRLSNQSKATVQLQQRLRKKPICGPSDDIDSDTPVFKVDPDRSPPNRQAVLGELYHTSSEDLMEKIYSPFTQEIQALNIITPEVETEGVAKINHCLVNARFQDYEDRVASMLLKK